MFKDLFDVMKYKRKLNTLEVKYIALNDKYVKLLETKVDYSERILILENTIKELRGEKRELKKELAEVTND